MKIKEGKSIMKKITKSILTSILCAVMILTGITASNTSTVYAASKKTPFTLTFNRKTVTLSDDLNDSLENGIDNVKFKTLKSKWGKASISQIYTDYGSYTWLKGKSYVTYHRDFRSSSSVDHIIYEAFDKNVSICGIKVGMKKSTVLKKLKKLVDTENIDVHEEYIIVTNWTDHAAGYSGLTSVFFTS